MSNRTTIALSVAVSLGLLTASSVLAQSGWGEPLKPKAPESSEPPPVRAPEPAPAREPKPEPGATAPNPDWADAPPTKYERRSPDNPDWIEEDEASPIGDQRDNASRSYDIRYANRSLTMPRGMMRGTFDAVVGRREELQGMFEPFGPTGTISTLNLGAALTIATDFEIGFSRYRMGSYPPVGIFPDFGFGGSGLISMIVAPEAKFGDMPFYARFQPLNNGVSQIAIDAVVRIPTGTEVGFLMGVPMRFVAKEHYAFDTGINFNVDKNLGRDHRFQHILSRALQGQRALMIYELDHRKVRIEGEVFVADSAEIIGSVVLKNRSSVWFNAVVRGDSDEIVIGGETNVQDGALLHTDPGIPLTLGRGVTVGHHAVVHGCQVGDYSLIGINAVILNNATIGRYCTIGANALVTQGQEIPDYSVVLGSPGKIVRQLEPSKREGLEKSAAGYVERARLYLRSLHPDIRFS